MAYKDKRDQAASASRHYESNKDVMKERALIRNARYKKFISDAISEYKMSIGCVDCGYAGHSAALEFDHISDDKEYTISKMVSARMPIERIMKEIAKCEVVCANCHRVRTHNRSLARKLVSPSKNDKRLLELSVNGVVPPYSTKSTDAGIRELMELKKIHHMGA